MNAIVFNICLLLAWFLISAGVGLDFGLGYGLIACGVTLVVFCEVARRVAGGIYTSSGPPRDPD